MISDEPPLLQDNEPVDAEAARDIEALRALIAANEKRHDEVRAFNRERAVEKEQYLEARLERMNEFRAAMQDQAAHFVTRGEFETAKAAGVERAEATRANFELRLENELAPVHTTLGEMGKPNWPLVVSAGSVFIGACAGIWLILGLKIDNSVAPMQLVLESVRTQGVANTERLHFVEGEAAASTQADTASRTDRAQLSERVHQLEGVLPTGATAVAQVANLQTTVGQITDRLQTIRTNQAQQAAALVEIETQFCAADTMRNLMHANDLRIESLLWAKTFAGETYPIGNAYYPRIGRCQTAAETTGNGSR
jgi:flagellin-like hook-associated protein FlgL